MRLAVDVMGGDHAPGAILEGVLAALPQLGPDDRLALVGPRREIDPFVAKHAPRDARLSVADCSEVIGMDESPVDSVRAKPDSSIVQMCLLAGHKAPEADRLDAVLSAGNTGACVSAATMYMRRLPGAHRPGIAVTIPSFHGPMVLCDAGANPEPRPIHLAQYAIMAETYARHVLRIERPRIALLNIGAEEAKGTRITRQVRDLIKLVPDANYIGYIEGRELFDGVADVVVTDGFVGNTILKLSEGLALALLKSIAGAVMQADPELAARFQPLARSLLKRNDYQEYGGAPLLGVNGVCIICHGSAKPRMIERAILQAREFVASGVNAQIVRRLTETAPIIEPQAAAMLAQQARSA